MSLKTSLFMRAKKITLSITESVIHRHYYKHFECHYELHWYPFDTQECFIEISPFADLKKFVELVTEDFIYEGPMELTQFVIKRQGLKFL